MVVARTDIFWGPQGGSRAPNCGPLKDLGCPSLLYLLRSHFKFWFPYIIRHEIQLRSNIKSIWIYIVHVIVLNLFKSGPVKNGPTGLVAPTLG